MFFTLDILENVHRFAKKNISKFSIQNLKEYQFSSVTLLLALLQIDRIENRSPRAVLDNCRNH